MARPKKKIGHYEEVLLKEQIRVLNKQRSCIHDFKDIIIICRCCGKHFEDTEMDKKMRAKVLIHVNI